MNDNRNMLLAIVLSALVLIGWSFLSDAFFPTAGPQTQQVEKGKVRPAPQPQAGPAVETGRIARCAPRGHRENARASRDKAAAGVDPRGVSSA